MIDIDKELEWVTEWDKEDRHVGVISKHECVVDVDWVEELLTEVKRLRKELAHYTDNCTIVWMPEDVLTLDDTLTDEQVSWVLERMKHKHDACLGISWDTIGFWIGEVKKNEHNF